MTHQEYLDGEGSRSEMYAEIAELTARAEKAETVLVDLFDSLEPFECECDDGTTCGGSPERNVAEQLVAEIRAREGGQDATKTLA